MSYVMALEELGIDLRGKRYGQVKTRCPRCGPDARHRNKTDLSVNIDDGVYTCWNPGCGFQGTVKQKEERRPMSERPQPRYETPALPEQRTLDPDAERWLNGRGISTDTAIDMGLWSESGALSFPYYRGDRVVHVKSRALRDKRFWSSEKTEPVFYNLTGARGAETVIVVEGEMDVLSFVEAGIESAISVPAGAPGEGQQAGQKLACMGSALEIFERARKVIIATDNDGPGQTLAAELRRRIGPEKCWRVKWPEGCKDANDVLLKHGIAGIAELVEFATPEPVEGLIYAADIADLLWQTRHERKYRGVDPGWENLEPLYRPTKKQMTIITGTPSSGKSAWLAALMVNVATSDGWKFGIFSPETFPSEEMYKILLELKVGKPLAEMTWDEYRLGLEFCHRHFIVQSPERPTLDEVLRLAKTTVLRHGVDAIVIDPYTEIEKDFHGGVSETERIGQDLARVRRFGQLHDLHTFIVAHPTKPEKGQKQRPIGPYDVSGSANWFNKADAFISVFRTDRTRDDAPVQVHVLKIRFRECGKLGAAHFSFDLASGRYEPLPDPVGE